MKKHKLKPKPSANGESPPESGRDAEGRFRLGNTLGRGGAPLAGKALQLRAALLAAVTPEDVKEIAAKLIAKANRGDTRCIRELLNRCVGKPVPTSEKEPTELLTHGDELLARRVEALRSLRLRHGAGEHLDDSPDEDVFMAAREQLIADPVNERRRIVRELREFKGEAHNG